MLKKNLILKISAKLNLKQYTDDTLNLKPNRNSDLLIF